MNKWKENSGICSNYFQDSEKFETELQLSAHKISKYAGLTYDAVWAIALSLKDVYPLFEQEFNYGRSDIVCEFVRRMSSLNFMGVSVSTC